MIECLITGCELVFPNEGAAVHGDLHIVADKRGTCYVFNAVLDDGDARRTFKVNVAEMMAGTQRVISVDSSNAFERRGVFVFLPQHASPNGKAFDYMLFGGD
jgi:hypothetical protein